MSLYHRRGWKKGKSAKMDSLCHSKLRLCHAIHTVSFLLFFFFKISKMVRLLTIAAALAAIQCSVGAVNLKDLDPKAVEKKNDGAL
jgi:hypothetical protein